MYRKDSSFMEKIQLTSWVELMLRPPLHWEGKISLKLLEGIIWPRDGLDRKHQEL